MDLISFQDLNERPEPTEENTDEKLLISFFNLNFPEVGTFLYLLRIYQFSLNNYLMQLFVILTGFYFLLFDCTNSIVFATSLYQIHDLHF
jgi:hypothetical protein